MLVTPRTAPAAQNRYIYYPDHLVRVPAPQKGVSPITQITTLLSTLLREPLFETFLWSLITEAFKEPLPNMPEDESVTDFISRRWSPEVANNLVSSMYHGILAGDIDKLSAEAFLGSVRLTEKKGKSVIAGFIEKTRAGRMLVSTDDNIAAIILGKTKPLEYIKSMEDLVQNGSTLTLRRGVGQLTDTLVTALKQSNKVQVLTNANVTSIRQDSQGPKLTVCQIEACLDQGSLCIQSDRIYRLNVMVNHAATTVSLPQTQRLALRHNSNTMVQTGMQRNLLAQSMH